MDVHTPFEMKWNFVNSMIYLAIPNFEAKDVMMLNKFKQFLIGIDRPLRSIERIF